MSILRPTRFLPQKRQYVRNVEFEVSGGWNSLSGISGIYSMTIGDMVYIGQSKNILNRIKGHRTHINNSCIEGLCMTDGYGNIMTAIWNQPAGTVTIKVKVEEQVEVAQLVNREDFWIRATKKKGKCLNYLLRKQASL